MKKKLPGTGPYAVFTVKVTLLDTDPPIWRRLRLPANATLADLHWVLQTAFDWTNSHMHHFMHRLGTDDVAYYGKPDKNMLPDLGFGHDTRDEKKARLCNLLEKAGDICHYEYDFGDSWMHEIALEEIVEAPVRPAAATCLAGEKAAPPEDCGGIPGFYHNLEVLKKPGHPEHADVKEWMGDYDPAAFDPVAVSRRLARVKL
jgi:hypothetical protein